METKIPKNKITEWCKCISCLISRNKKSIFFGIIGILVLTLGFNTISLGAKLDLFNDQNVKVYTSCDVNEAKRVSVSDSLETLKAKNPNGSLRTLDAKDKANLKGCEIAKISSVPKQRVQFSGADYFIEVQSFEPIDQGVQLFARAWDSNNNPVGFGVDGSVEIERFRIINPPILVDDPSGSIVRTQINDRTGQIETRRLREDMQRAVLESLAHTIKLVGKDGKNIIVGKMGNTTTTVYPDPSPESTSVDGKIVSGGQTTWGAARGATTGTANDSELSHDQAILSYAGAADNWQITRAIYVFDTSSITDTDTIDSAVLSIFVKTNSDGDNDGDDYINIYASTPATDTAVIGDDYDQINTTAQATSIDLTAGFTNETYADFTLNATGLGNVSKTAVSKFGAREGHDAVNNQPATSSGDMGIGAYFADTAGTTKDPKLVVQHSAASTAKDVTSDTIFFQ